MRFGGCSFGSIRIDGLRYDLDVVIDRAADLVFIMKRGGGMSDGREEREEREKRREQEERENREDRNNRNHVAEWEQERVDS
jgi:hypothetical protein